MKKIFVTLVLILIVLTGILVYLCAFSVSKDYSESYTFTPQSSFETPVNRVVPERTSEQNYVFPEVPGITYSNNNENLLRYLYMIHNDSGIYVFGQAVHLGKIQPSMEINYQLKPTEENMYQNTDGSVILSKHQTDDSYELIDRRNGPIMSMSGTYKLCKKAVAEETKTSVNNITVYDAPELNVDTEPYVGTWVEQVEYPMHVQFIKNIDNNGMEFVTDENKVIYVFGGQFQDASGTWMDLDVIYRGNNPKYNGHDFGGQSYHCFNLARRR